VIIKGGSHTGKGLGAYLLQDKNERAEVWGIRGDIPRDLPETLDDWRSAAHGIQCKKPLYHAQLNPDRALSREEWEQAITLFEKELGYENQPRAIVLHEYKGREHLHLVYSRIGEDGKAIPDSWNYLHHEKAARAIESELGLEPTQGALYQAKEQPRPERTPSHGAIQQGERTQIDPKAVKAELTALYRGAEGNAPAFLQALKQQGYSLARGDKRGFVVVDGSGGVHSLTRATGAKAGELREMLKDCHDLPSVEEAKAAAEAQRQSLAELQAEAGGHDDPAPDIAEAKPAPEARPEPGEEPEATYWQDKVSGETESEGGSAASAPVNAEDSPEANSSISDPLNICFAEEIATHGEIQHRGLLKSWVEHALDWAYEIKEDLAYVWEVFRGGEPDLLIPGEPDRDEPGYWQGLVSRGKPAEAPAPEKEPGDHREPKPTGKKHFWQRFLGREEEAVQGDKDKAEGIAPGQAPEPGGNRFQQLTRAAKEQGGHTRPEPPESGLARWRRLTQGQQPSKDAGKDIDDDIER
jgi:hypothetical protein